MCTSTPGIPASAGVSLAALGSSSNLLASSLDGAMSLLRELHLRGHSVEEILRNSQPRKKWWCVQRQLLEQMARLSGEQYEQAIAIILARYPGAANNVGEELNLDLSVADALTLRQLQHFCHVCLHPADPPTSWPGLLVGTGGVTPALSPCFS